MNKIATDIQNFITSQTIKASDKQNADTSLYKTAKINGTISLKRGHLLAEIDLSRIKSAVYSSDVHRTEWKDGQLIHTCLVLK